ncbi:MAG: hypothetical protein IKV87_00200 [Methanobrevibacter sp.]|nr:hypothetical protein [Methanobrevibacter sp.]
MLKIEDIVKEYIDVKINLNLTFGSILDELGIEYETFVFYDEYKSICLDLEMYNKELSDEQISRIGEKTGFEFRKVEVIGKKFPFGNGDEINYTYVFEC